MSGETVTYVGWDWTQAIGGCLYGAATLWSAWALAPGSVSSPWRAVALFVAALFALMGSVGAFFRLTIRSGEAVLRKGFCGVTTRRWAIKRDSHARVMGTLDWGECGADGGDASAELELAAGVEDEGRDYVLFGSRNLADELVAAVNRDLEST